MESMCLGGVVCVRAREGGRERGVSIGRLTPKPPRCRLSLRVCSQQALQVERGSADGLTQACKLFQESAGMFAFLRDHEANKVDAPRPVDLTPECCALMERLMLAQAQVGEGGCLVG
jgi:hypothetical protein